MQFLSNKQFQPDKEEDTAFEITERELSPGVVLERG